ncbi:MAG TPA: hypothetical protein VJ801_14670 [Polyangia bacterium]|jgi:hypothetical protein|nr:hypothetical protein [Polyangia bacterium]
MTSDQVKTDATGLHSEDCDCVRCDAGYRPTELERAAARRSLALQQAALARQSFPPPAGPLPRCAAPSVICPPTPEQFEELKRLREQLYVNPERKPIP